MCMCIFACLETQSQPAPGTPQKPIQGLISSAPAIPLSLPDYELVSLDVKKKVIFHVRDQTVVGEIPILVYVPIARSGRLEAMDRLIEARAILIKAAAGQPTGEDMNAVRQLLERALAALQKDTPTTASNGAAARKE